MANQTARQIAHLLLPCMLLLESGKAAQLPAAALQPSNQAEAAALDSTTTYCEKLYGLFAACSQDKAVRGQHLRSRAVKHKVRRFEPAVVNWGKAQRWMGPFFQKHRQDILKVQTLHREKAKPFQKPEHEAAAWGLTEKLHAAWMAVKDQPESEEESEEESDAESSTTTEGEDEQEEEDGQEGQGEDQAVASQSVGQEAKFVQWYYKTDDSNGWKKCEVDFSREIQAFSEKRISPIKMQKSDGQVYDIRLFWPIEAAPYGEQYRRGAGGTSRMLTSEQPDQDGLIESLPLVVE